MTNTSLLDTLERFERLSEGAASLDGPVDAVRA